MYALLAGVCLSAHLLRGVGSLPVPTTTTSTESPPISPAVSSDADTDESTAEASREVAYYTAVASTSRQDSPGSSRTYTVTAIFKKPAPSPQSDDSTDEQPTDPNLPLSSAVVSSSTAEESSCSSGLVQRGPCRKRSASTERISKEVLDFYTPGAKRSLREGNPSSAPNWAVPNLEKVAGPNETSSAANSQSRQSRQSSHSRDSDSSSPESSNKEASSASKSSSDSSSTTDKSQPGTPM